MTDDTQKHVKVGDSFHVAYISNYDKEPGNKTVYLMVVGEDEEGFDLYYPEAQRKDRLPRSFEKVLLAFSRPTKEEALKLRDDLAKEIKDD